MSLAYKISAFNRRRKWQIFLEKFPPAPDWKILDVGFNAIEYSNTDNFLEKNYPWPENITALGLDKPAQFQARYPKVQAVQYDGGLFPFPDGAFDLVWSNAVLEHVGGRHQQIDFLREIKRTGKRFFLTTPNRFFPVEVHTRLPFVHFLPKAWFDRIARLAGQGWAAGDYMRLLSEKDLRTLLKQAGFDDYQIIRNHFFGLTLDFIVYSKKNSGCLYKQAIVR